MLDFRAAANGQHAGNKHDAVIDVELGGCPINTGVFGPANGIPTVAIGAQKKGMWSGICRGLALDKGLRLVLLERDKGPSASLIAPNGGPGSFNIYTQRVVPPTVDELAPEIGGALGAVQAVVVGPMRWSAETRDLLLHVPSLFPWAYRALVPHREMIGDPDFARVARRYDYVQINAQESRLLDGATDDLAANARRLSFLIGEHNECSVTNGSERGFLWSRSRWISIDPPCVGLVDDTGCGDSFTAAYVIGRALLGLDAEGALSYAIDAAAATATQIGVARPLPYRPSS